MQVGRGIHNLFVHPISACDAIFFKHITMVSQKIPEAGEARYGDRRYSYFMLIRSRSAHNIIYFLEKFCLVCERGICNGEANKVSSI